MKLDLDIGIDLIDNGTSDDYYTPPAIFEALGLIFDIDVCSPPGGVPWIPKKMFYTATDDGLAQEWQGLIWCNPPYSGPTPWARKMIDHNNGIALVPLSKSKWFNEMWEASSGAVILPPNLKFIRGNGAAMPIFMPVMLHAFGIVAANALATSHLGRMR